MIRILHVLSSLDGGGVEKLLQNYYSRMDRQQFQFDFIVHGKRRGMLEAYFEQQGSQIWHVVPKSLNPVGNLIQMNRVMRAGHYDAVHGHQDVMSALSLYLAKRNGIRVRIAHSHVAEVPKKKPFEQFLRKLLMRSATQYMACSEAAGLWLFGEAITAGEQFRVLNNAISLDSFRWQPGRRSEVRKQLGVEHKLVIGNVSRYTYQKNHEFVLAVFAELLKQQPDAVLMLAGEGPRKKQIERQADEIGIRDKILFLGVRQDVGDLMLAMDSFLLPSRYEGFGIVLLEAQVSGLPCFTSQHVVPTAANVTGTVEYLPLAAGAKVWADQILSCQERERKNYSPLICAQGFDIDTAAKVLETCYREYVSASR